ncbi:hypothetical protein C8R42DRAFT_728301 [Lentinula raphanica]|nr:hypothetical protein C8R42DRAFT_728301 [Lentinula raphanica]
MSSATILSRTPIIRSTASRLSVRPQNRFLNNFGHSSHIPPHTEVNHLPFNYLNKRAFTYKFVSYLGLGFALPWVAVGWIWYETDSSCEKDVMTEQDCESGIVPVATKTLTEELIALFRWLYLSVVRVSQNPP